MANEPMESPNESVIKPTCNGSVEEKGQENCSIFHLIKELTCRQRLGLLSLLLGEISAFCCFSLMSAFFPSVAAKKASSPVTTGLIFAILEFGIFILSPVFGKFLYRLGYKRSFIGGLIICGSGTFLIGFVIYLPSGPLFISCSILARCVQAIGTALFRTACYAFVTIAYPKYVALFIGFLESCAGLGFVIGPLLGGLLYETSSFVIPFVVFGASMVGVAIMAQLLLPTTATSKSTSAAVPPPQPEQTESLIKPGEEMREDTEFAPVQTDKTTSTSVFKVISRWRVILVEVAIVFISSSWGVLDPVVEPFIMQTDPNITKFQIGLIFFISSGAYFVMAPVVGYVIDSPASSAYRSHFSMSGGAILCIIALSLLGPWPFLPFSQNMTLLVSSLCLLSVSVALSFVPAFRELLQVVYLSGFEKNIYTDGIVAGVCRACWSAGAFLGPIFGGLTVQAYGFRWTTFFLSTFQVSFVLLPILVLTFYSRRSQ